MLSSAQTPGIGAQFTVSSMCVPFNPDGSGVISFTMYSSAIDPGRGTLSVAQLNGTYGLLNLRGGIGDVSCPLPTLVSCTSHFSLTHCPYVQPLRNSFYAGNTSSLVRITPSAGAPLAAVDVIFSASNPNATFLLGAIATAQGFM